MAPFRVEFPKINIFNIWGEGAHPSSQNTQKRRETAHLRPSFFSWYLSDNCSPKWLHLEDSQFFNISGGTYPSDIKTVAVPGVGKGPLNPPTLSETKKKWAFSSTKWSQLRTFWGSCPVKNILSPPKWCWRCHCRTTRNDSGRWSCPRV